MSLFRRRRQAYGSVWLPSADAPTAAAPVRPEDIPAQVLGGATQPQRSFDDWWAEGQARGWVSKPFCGMHHIEPMSATERETWEAGYDACTPGTVRVWPLAGRGEGGHDG